MKNKNYLSSPPKAALAVFLFLTTIVVIFSFFLQSTIKSQIQADFEKRVERISDQLKEQVASYERGIRGTRSALLAGGVQAMKLEEFRMIMRSRDPETEFPGVLGFGYIERVPVSSIEMFISRTEIHRGESFRIKELNEHSGDHFVIKYIEPEDKNAAAVGLDIGSEENRRDAMNQAMRSGEAVLTEPITLVQASGKTRHGFLLLLPIYPNHNVPDNADDRFDSAIGAAYAPIIIDDVLDPIFDNQLYNMEISEVINGEVVTFYGSNFTDALTPFKSVQKVQIFNQMWEIEYEATPAFLSGYFIPSHFGVISIGFLIALSFAALSYRQFSSRLRLKSQSSTLESLMRHSPTAIALFDDDLNPVIETAVWRDNFNEQEVLRLDSLFQPDELKASLAGNKLYKKSVAFEAADGSKCWYQSLVEPWFDENGDIGGIIIILENITDLTSAQQELELINRNLESIVASRTRELEESNRENQLLLQAIDAQLMFLITDAEGNIQRVNRKLCENVGYSEQELLGNTFKLIRSKKHDTVFWENLWENISQGNSWRSEICNLTKSGSFVWWDSVIFPIRGPAGDIHSYISISQDITERHQIQDALQIAVERANKANLAKSQFLSAMSHEIRTPLNAMIGTLYLLRRTALDTSQAELVDNINIASESLLLIINDILDFSKIEAGELLLEKKPVNLEKLLNELYVLFHIQANNKKLQFEIGKVPSTLPKNIVSDGYRIKQMLVNLLSNAIKFTSSGKVSLALSELNRSEQNIELQFEVTDTGIGMSDEAQKIIFDAFTQADVSTTRKYGGSGLGLSIVKRLAISMGGGVEVESKQDEGAKFILRIVAQYTQHTEAKQNEISFSRPLRVLIADDDATERDVLLAMATELGWESTVVNSGKALVDQVLKGSVAYDCIISDWKMPEMDGLEAIEQIHNSLGEKMPGVIMVTSFDRQDLLENERAIHADAILAKPVRKKSLFASVNNAAASHASGGYDILNMTKIELDDHLWLDGVRVLVVDDNEINLLVTQKILNTQGASVDMSDSGRDAIEKLRADSGGYDAILMDVQMPDMSGLQVTEIIRKDLNLTIPIIALTAGVSIEEKESVLDAGMNDFLSKPVEPENMVRLLIKHLSFYNRNKFIF
ncbi:MAG: response regulator [Methylophaga sp.]|nr:response regulator [Methylophaga sp.]